jgi:hypothetical protein
MLASTVQICPLPLALPLLAQRAQPQTTSQIAGPLVPFGNLQYFSDVNGATLILNGSQSWNKLQDFGTDGSLQAFDFHTFGASCGTSSSKCIRPEKKPGPSGSLKAFRNE